MMYGQMTAGSWIYIGSQGIVQGTYETFAEAGRQHYGGAARRPVDPDRRPRRHGRRAAAGGDDGRRVDARDRVPAEPHRDAPRDALPRPAGEAISTMRSRSSTTRAPRSGRCRVGLLGNAAEILPELVRRGVRPDMVTDQTSAHDLVYGYLPAGWTRRALAGRAGRSRAACGAHARRRSNRSSRTSSAMLAFQRQGIPTFDYGNNIRQVAHDEGVADAFAFPGFVPAYIRPLFCEGKGPFRWVALSGDPEDIYKTDRKVKELFPDNAHLQRWLDDGEGAHRVPGVARAHLLAGAGRAASRRACVQRDGEERRIEGAHRHRPRSPRHRLRREPEPRDRSDGRRLRRGVRLAAAQPAAQHRRAARRGCRSITAAASAWATRSTRASSSSATARTPRRSASSACCGTIRRPASCATPTRATRWRSTSRRAKGLKLPMLPR